MADVWAGGWDRLAPSGEPREPPALDAWECPACGRVLRQPDLPGGRLEDARDQHLDAYCARPAPWPSG
jgi:hypothetical protein